MSHYKRNAKKKKNKNPFKKTEKQNKSDLENAEIEKLKHLYEDFDGKNVKRFKDFPLSRRTQKGLLEANFVTPTAIQKEAIGYALKGQDILGAAITGSGKTLAFLIPILESLFVKRWTRLDGLGAIIISPTRELAYQIFETLKKVGIHHEFSAALVIGGKNLKFERKRMDQCNIIICTPGRLLQHMDENPLFNCVSLQVLVLDEADRILDLGFETTMNGIIENFPADRQTLLFSATQTKSVRDLARLSLKNPVYVAPHAQSLTTPVNLKQNYVVIELEDKFTMLWSFIKNHLKQKVIVFMSSCKQVKFVTEMFTKLRAGTPIYGLYGTLHQDRRVTIYNEFIRKSHAVLISTDVASRGLDFPVVNWVIQLDCPEDATAYIHRAGRTARHNAKGESLLVLLPSEEEAMVEELNERKIEINKIFVDSKKLFSPRVKMEAYLAQNMELKATAQRAFVSYIKSVFLMKNKKIFNVDAINADAYARSFGLVVTPRIQFLEKRRAFMRMRNKENNAEKSDDDDNEEDDSETSDNQVEGEREDKSVFQFPLSDDDDDSDDSGDGLIKLKRKDHQIDVGNKSTDESDDDDNDGIAQELNEMRSKKKSKPVTKAALAKKLMKKQIQANRKVVYDEDGNIVCDPTKQLQSELARKLEDEEEGGGIDIEQSKAMLREEDQYDKQRFKDLVKARHKEKKRKLKQKKIADDEDDEEHDDFGSDEEDSDQGPDLSWLPDPDKIYGKKTESDDDEPSYSDDENDDDDDDKIHRPPSHLVVSKKHKKSHLDDVEDDERPMKKRRKKFNTEDLSVNEAETLAMQLLGSG